MSLAGRYLVHLPHFEGPLPLLLYLIRKEEMDIFNININSITRTYLEHIRLMKELDLEVAGDFVAMAATLIQIKSRMLLPQYNEEGEIVETEDPRKELVQKLIEYQRYQDAGKQLYARPLLNRDVWARGLREDLRGGDEGEIIIEDEGLFGLIASYRRAMKKAERLVHRVRAKTQSIAGRVLEIKDRLLVGTRVMLSELLDIGEHPYRHQLLITFLSLLELGRLGFVGLFQNEIYGEIYVEPKKTIERNVLERVQEFDSAGAEAVANSIINDAVAEAEELAADRIVQDPFAELGDEAQPAFDMVMGEGSDSVVLEEGTEPGMEAVVDDATAAAPPQIATDEELARAEEELGLTEDGSLVGDQEAQT